MPDRIGNRPTPVVPQSTSSSSGSYTIQSGDTLSRIAQRHGVSTQALINANTARYPNLATNPGAIQVGWSLSIPTGGTTPSQPSAPTQPQGWAPRSNDNVLLVGMNATSQHEVDQLKARGTNVTYVKDTKENDKITTRDATGTSVTHDLSTEAGARSFALTLGLPAEQTAKIASAIHGAGSDARDELAQVAQVWAKAEQGGQVPSRMVLSGHNVGSGVWGDDNGRMSFDSLAQLADAMPKAARSVEDLHLSACYSGGEHLMDKYRAMFPNAKTIWAYTGSAPGSYSGATAHMARWDRATRGTKDELDRAIAEGTRKGENVAVWSAAHGYVDGKPPAPLAEVRAAVQNNEGTFKRFQSGQEKVQDTQSGPLREYYNQVQRLLQHPELPAGERAPLEGRRDETIRLIYYSKTVAPKFAEHHAATIRDGFAAVGMPAPKFGELSRGDALAQIAQFEAKLASTNPKPAVADRLLPLLQNGLRDLKPNTIPDAWI
ncbi:MAG: LysM peptidoglycan-binding domain-containing protein [Myxococcaceae bacterium]|nr:LysM peptidoglycan-binding domain-containing protein [Myxococcaceae bacterium]